jgi:hypothetical protein
MYIQFYTCRHTQLAWKFMRTAFVHSWWVVSTPVGNVATSWNHIWSVKLPHMQKLLMVDGIRLTCKICWSVWWLHSRVNISKGKTWPGKTKGGSETIESHTRQSKLRELNILKSTETIHKKSHGIWMFPSRKHWLQKANCCGVYVISSTLGFCWTHSPHQLSLTSNLVRVNNGAQQKKRIHWCP